MSTHLQNLIRQGEHQQLDFKFAVNDARKIARTLASFSNTSGGTLLIGVKDNGAIAGVRSEEELYVLEAAASMYCQPPVRFEVRKWDFDKKSVLEVIVPKSPQRPHMAKDEHDEWKVYIRSKDQNFIANKVLLKVWEMKKSGEKPTVRYTEKEEWLIKYLEDHDCITLSAFCKMAVIPKFIAEKILINLISMKLVKMTFTEKGVFYSGIINE